MVKIEVGISQSGLISPADIEFCDDIRKICESNSCHLYVKTRACPLAVGTLDECKERAVFLIGYIDDNPYACGALKEINQECGEIKRIYARRNNCHMGSHIFGSIGERSPKIQLSKTGT